MKLNKTKVGIVGLFLILFMLIMLSFVIYSNNSETVIFDERIELFESHKNSFPLREVKENGVYKINFALPENAKNSIRIVSSGIATATLVASDEIDFRYTKYGSIFSDGAVLDVIEIVLEPGESVEITHDIDTECVLDAYLVHSWVMSVINGTESTVDAKLFIAKNGADPIYCTSLTTEHVINIIYGSIGILILHTIYRKYKKLEY